jgi:hypothetical protein
MSNTSKPADQEVQMDRRRKERRAPEALEGSEGPKTEFNPPRRRKERRRQIDPTTCERDYNNDEIAFMQALDAYKRSSGRMFPTCSEILEVVRSLGYIKLSDEEQQILTSIAAVETELAENTREPLDGDELSELENEEEDIFA